VVPFFYAIIPIFSTHSCTIVVLPYWSIFCSFQENQKVRCSGSKKISYTWKLYSRSPKPFISSRYEKSTNPQSVVQRVNVPGKWIPPLLFSDSKTFCPKSSGQKQIWIRSSRRNSIKQYEKMVFFCASHSRFGYP
jgi:hypothetical protein